jgi:hypothetical protein
MERTDPAVGRMRGGCSPELTGPARKAVPDRDTLGGPPSISFWSKSPCQTRSRPVSVTLGPFCRIALKAQLLDDVIALFDGLRRREGNSWRT